MEVLLQTITNLLDNPTEDNKKLFMIALENEEYNTLLEAEKFNYKSQEYFDYRNLAFSLRSKIATDLVPQWIALFGSSDGCPLQYRDTLGVPFREIKKRD